ncbi:hypothetical protein EON73_02695 [bacterium]|nr:MAG: hypothetical protein EON73_02695 [bacterium]
MSVLCTNIQGLRNNFTEFKYVLRIKKPVIVFLNETHVTEDCDISDLYIKDYISINCLSHSKHTGGVCAFIHKSIKYTNLSVIKENIAWYLSFEIFIHKSPIVMAGIYLSASENKNLVLESFEKWYENVAENKTIVICGDFNVDMNSNTTHSRKLKSICDDNGLKMFVNTPTRVTQNSSTFIDLCLSNIVPNKLECSVSIDNQISDHAIIEMNVMGKYETNTQKVRQISVWKEYNAMKLCDTLENYLFSWQYVQNASVNEKMDWLIDILRKSTNQFQTKKSIRVNDDFFDKEL